MTAEKYEPALESVNDDTPFEVRGFIKSPCRKNLDLALFFVYFHKSRLSKDHIHSRILPLSVEAQNCALGKYLLCVPMSNGQVPKKVDI